MELKCKKQAGCSSLMIHIVCACHSVKPTGHNSGPQHKGERRPCPSGEQHCKLAPHLYTYQTLGLYRMMEKKFPNSQHYSLSSLVFFNNLLWFQQINPIYLSSCYKLIFLLIFFPHTPHIPHFRKILSFASSWLLSKISWALVQDGIKWVYL